MTALAPCPCATCSGLASPFDSRVNTCAQVIKRFILHAKRTAFVVEHDFIMATYLADRVIVYEGTPGVDATARTPQTLLTGAQVSSPLPSTNAGISC